MSANYDPHYYKCGCYVRDISSYGTKIFFTRCKKHEKEMISCSWLTWAKKHAPAQYRQYKKDIA